MKAESVVIAENSLLDQQGKEEEQKKWTPLKYEELNKNPINNVLTLCSAPDAGHPRLSSWKQPA